MPNKLQQMAGLLGTPDERNALLAMLRPRPTQVRGLLETVPQLEPRRLGEALAATPIPVVSDVASGLLAADDVRKGDYKSAALNGLGLLPFVPAMAGAVRLGTAPMTLYHGTTKEAAQRIAKEGLRSPEEVYNSAKWYMLVDNPEAARIFGDEVLKFDIPADKAKSMLWPGSDASYGSQYALRNGLIPPEFISK